MQKSTSGVKTIYKIQKNISYEKIGKNVFLLLIVFFSITGVTKMNRLQYEESPYLLQHKTNPVDWYPWSEEAFQKAESEDKPIFLSIGYSTCHWCHVMEKESFEDETVAELLNKFFVSIKVDREERPDIDHIYMQMAQMMGQQGGWPLTVIMSHKKEPFFIATYIPKNGHPGRPGMLQLLPYINDIWHKKRDDISNVTNQVNDLLTKLTHQQSDGKAHPSLLTQAVKELSNRFDSKNGGFSTAPKFPTPHVMIFLLRQSLGSNNDKQLQEMVKQTLDHLSRGGIYDHIGYGFHRYSTDDHWLLPHFEKMLYDQAMLVLAYAEYFSITKDTTFSEIPKQVIEYVIRDLKSHEGGFFCAEDADSEGEEGKFYVWSYSELEEHLSAEELKFTEKMYGIKKEGNFSEEANNEPSFKNIFHIEQSRLNKNSELFNANNQNTFSKIRKKLFLEREKRIRPHKDKKILTDWNGLMITALARMALIFDEKIYLKEAQSTMSFILDVMQDENKELLHFRRNHGSHIKGYLDDYSNIIWALIELYQASFDVFYLEEAVRLTDIMIKLFWDEENGAFFFTSKESEKLLLRNKEWYDGALPSGNSIACYTLTRLSELTGNHTYKEMALRLVNSGNQILKNFPSGYSFMMMSFDYLIRNHTQVVILSKDVSTARKAISKLQKEYDPFRSFIVIEEKTHQRHASLASFTKNMTMLNGKTTAYICENFFCKKPINID